MKQEYSRCGFIKHNLLISLGVALTGSVDDCAGTKTGSGPIDFQIIDQEKIDNITCFKLFG